jgi:hypothetical protein
VGNILRERPAKESRRADSNRLPLLITSEKKEGCRALREVAEPAYLSRFYFSELLSVSGCRTLGDVEVM